MAREVEVHGHRGSRGTHVENTFPGFMEGVRAGADFLEIDIQLSADDVPVVYHDPMISGRICYTRYGSVVKRPVPVRALRAGEIQRYFCGTYVDPRFPAQELVPGSRIPLLEEVLCWRKEHAPEIRLNLELKLAPDPNAPPPPVKAFAKAVVRLIRAHRAHAHVLVQSFSERVLEAVRRLDDAIEAGRLFRRDMDFLKKSIGQGFSRVTIYHEILEHRDVDTLRHHGFQVLSYTINRESRWRELLHCGIDGIITDYPARLVTFLSRQEDQAAG